MAHIDLGRGPNTVRRCQGTTLSTGALAVAVRQVLGQRALSYGDRVRVVRVVRWDVAHIDLTGGRPVSYPKCGEDVVGAARDITHATGCAHSYSCAHQEDGRSSDGNHSLVKQPFEHCYVKILDPIIAHSCP